MKILKIFFLISFLFTSFLFGSEKKIEVGIDEQLGSKIPMDAVFKDEEGNTVRLKELVSEKPTVLGFVYYECPGICTPLMSSIAQVVNESDLKPGVDYDIVTISINTDETPKVAAEKKANFMKLIEKDFPASAWRFLTGDSSNVYKATNSAGFYFKRQGKDFVHSGALLFINKNGTISRYLFPQYSERHGYSILPFDFKMAIIETSEGKVTPTIARVLQFCFSYDPQGNKYALNITRIFGAGILLLAAAFVIFLKVKPKKKK